MQHPQTRPIQLSELTSSGLELLPCLDAITHRLAQWLRHVVARGLALRASEADVQMRAMLLALLAAAVWLAARAVGLGQRPEDRPLDQRGHLAQQPLLGLPDAPNRLHRLGDYHDQADAVQREMHDLPPFRYLRDCRG